MYVFDTALNSHGIRETAPRRQVWCSRKAVRAMRLASATATSIFDLPASHDPSGAPLRAAHLTAATAPVISNPSKPLRAATRMLSRCEADPGRKTPAFGEGLHRWRKAMIAAAMWCRPKSRRIFWRAVDPPRRCWPRSRCPNPAGCSLFRLQQTWIMTRETKTAGSCRPTSKFCPRCRSGARFLVRRGFRLAFALRFCRATHLNRARQDYAVLVIP